MTDRYWGVLVEFDHPIRTDDYEASVGPLLGMLRSVKSAQPLKDEGLGVDYLVRAARDEEWDRRLRTFIHEMRTEK